jgi:hypothetical protein
MRAPQSEQPDGRGNGMMSQVGIALLCAKANIAVVIDACRTNAKALQCVPTESLPGVGAMPSEFHKEAANCRRMAAGYNQKAEVANCPADTTCIIFGGCGLRWCAPRRGAVTLESRPLRLGFWRETGEGANPWARALQHISTGQRGTRVANSP